MRFCFAFFAPLTLTITSSLLHQSFAEGGTFGAAVQDTESIGQDTESIGQDTESIGQDAEVIGQAAEAGELAARNFLATDIDGRAFDLRKYAAGEPVVVALTSTSCPLCKKYGPTLAGLEKRYLDQGVRFVYITAIKTDSLEEAQAARDRLALTGPYLLDANGELVASLNAVSTTEAFLFDERLNLRYRGAVDDQYGVDFTKPAAKENYLAEAIDAVLGGTEVPVSHRDAPGCKLLPAKHREPNALEFHRDVHRVVQNRCVTCHREGGVGPFSLESAEDVIAHAGMIKEVVESKRMPPWSANADPQQPNRWMNDPSLSDGEKQNLLAWIDGPQTIGDRKDAPVTRVFESEWAIGEPDLVVELPQSIRVQESGYMDYIHKQIELDLPEDSWVTAVEIRPTAPEVVHHVLVYHMKKGGDVDIDERSHFLAAYAPGNSTQVYPSGFGKKLPGGSDLVVQMHYTPNGARATDRTKIAFRFAREKPQYEVRVTGIADTNLNIPAGAANHQEIASATIPTNVKALAFFPHMHLRGKAIKFDYKGKDGQSQTLLEIPKFDFNWQLEYRLQNAFELEAGSEVVVTGWFDNSAENPANPDASKSVHWGDQTFEEMLIGYVEYYVPSESGESDLAIKNQRQRPSMEQMFSRYDKDGDGKVSRDEFPKRLPFDVVDADKDGGVSLEELKQAMQRQRR